MTLLAYRLTETDNGDFQVIATFENPEKVYLKYRNDFTKNIEIIADTQWLYDVLYPLLCKIEDVLENEEKFLGILPTLPAKEQEALQKILATLRFKAINSYDETFFALADIYTALRRAVFLGFFDPQKQFPHIDFEAENQALHSAENFGSDWVIQDQSEWLDEGFYNLSSGFATLDELSLRAFVFCIKWYGKDFLSDQMRFSRQQVLLYPEEWEFAMINNKFDKNVYWDNPSFLLTIYPILQKTYPYQHLLQIDGIIHLSDAQLPDAFWQSLTEDEKEVAREIAHHIPVADWAVVCEIFQLAEKMGFLQFVKQTGNSNNTIQIFTFQKP